MEAIIILIAFTTFIGFKLFQIDVKSPFLNGDLKEDLDHGFEDANLSNQVFKLKKALDGLKQGPRA